MLKRLLCLMCCLMAALTGGFAQSAAASAADPAAEAQRLAREIIDGQLAASGAESVQAWLDGTLAQGIGSGAEWYVLALCQTGDYDLTRCREALARVLDASGNVPASTRLKYALTLAACDSGDERIARTLSDAAGQQGVMSLVFSLHLLRNDVSAPGVSAQGILDEILALQYADGGWALYGAASDPDVTAMTLQALAPYRQDAAVSAAIERGLTRLSALQRDDGGYVSFGVPNPETASQVLIALTELGVDAMADARFIKGGATLLDAIVRYRLPDGSYSHRLGDASNQNATMQALLAFTAYQRLKSGQPGLYSLDRPADDSITPASHPNTQFTPPVTGYKPIAAAVIAGLALAAALLLVVLKKRHRRNFLALALIAGILIAFVFLTDFQAADTYYSGQLPSKPDAIGSVTLSIDCRNAIGQPAAAHLPEDGVILAATEVPIRAGDTVFTVLTEAAQAFGIHLDSSGGVGMRYIRGMENLYEFSCGDLSGWLYTVNGESPSVGCEQYRLSDGDRIVWAYSLDMGGDLGLR